MTKSDAAVVTEGLGRSFGKVQAVAGVTMSIDRGSIVGLLGPNGSGKTTLIRMLSTLLRPTSGHAWINGADVSTDPSSVRRNIGLTGQYAAVDEFLSGRENLYMMGRLLGMSVSDATSRAHELLESFSLLEAADRPLSTYSGGMRRRLDLGLSLTGHPKIVFLDEPTTGLDPRSRFAMWNVIEALGAEGTTILLCTQYLEEADRLAERVIILDQGRVVAEGAPAKLRADVGGDIVEVTLRDAVDRAGAIDALSSIAAASVDVSTDDRVLRIPVRTAEELPEVVRVLDSAGVTFSGLALHEPTLDDVFLALTGHHATTAEPTGERIKELV